MVRTENLIADIFIIGLVIYATSLHELAHAYVATLLGDPTPGRYGRLTWNPIPHLSPVMTAVVLPVLFYISSKTLFILALTPINPSKFKRPLRDQALTAAAGPLTNFIITGILLGVLHIPGVYGYDPFTLRRTWTAIVLPEATFWIFVMGVFNLMPLPPLDGYWIFRVILPLQVRQKTDELARSQFAFVIVLIFGSYIFQFIDPATEALFRHLMPYPNPIGG